MITSQLPALNTANPQTLIDARRSSRSAGDEARATFASVLARQGGEVDAAAQEAAVRKGAEELVSAVLVQPILKQLHETNHAAAPFAPTSAEKQFQSMMDGKLALDFTHRSRFPLVDSVTRAVLARSNGAAKPTTENTPAPDAAAEDRSKEG